MGEFIQMLDGFYRRQEREWERTAKLGTWVVSPYTTKKLTPEQLMGRSFKTEPQRRRDG